MPLIYLKLMPQKISSSYTKVPGTIMHISKVPSASETDATKNKELVHKSTRYQVPETDQVFEISRPVHARRFPQYLNVSAGNRCTRGISTLSRFSSKANTPSPSDVTPGATTVRRFGQQENAPWQSLVTVTGSFTR